MSTPVEEIYTEGERILCYHGPLVYEAKCLKERKSAEDTNEYLVHYLGWNKSWDEWVPGSRILKYNDENLAKQKELLLSQKESKKRKSNALKTPKSANKEHSDVKSEGSVHDPDSRSSTPSVDGKQRAKNKGKNKESSPPPLQNIEPIEGLIPSSEIKEEPSDPIIPIDQPDAIPTPTINIEEEQVFVPVAKLPKLLKIEDIDYQKNVILSDPDNALLKIPTELNEWSLDDWYHINQLKRLVNLPAERTVSSILQMYEEFKIAKDPSCDQEQVRKLSAQIDEYFCTCLGSFLLYRCERPQYMDVLDQYPGCKMSQIYGVHHFLRLFQKSKMLLERLPVHAMEEVVKNLSDVLEFLKDHRDKIFFSTDYGIATNEYHRRCM